MIPVVADSLPPSIAFMPSPAMAPNWRAALIGLLVVEVSVFLALSYATWNRRKGNPLASTFLFVLLLFTSLIVGYALQVAAPTLALATLFFKLSQAAMILSPLPWLVFVLYFTGRESWLTPVQIGITAAVYAVILAALFTNSHHGFFYTGFALSSDGTLLVRRGPLHWLSVWLDYVLIGLGVMLMVEMYLASRIHRKTVAAILGGVIVPWFAHMTQFAGLPVLRDVNLTAVAIVVTGVSWYLAIFHFDAFELVPVAREQAIDAMNDGVVVVDQHGRIADANPAARDLLGESPIGTAAEVALSPVLSDVDAYLTTEDVRREEVVIGADRTAHLDVQGVALDTWRDEPGGHVLVLRDVTPLKEREAELQRQNERLEEFASIVSHDLRNPLNIAYAHVDSLDGAGETADDIMGALDRMSLIIDDVLSLARQGETVDETEQLPLRQVTEEAWTNVETNGAALRVEDDGAVYADEGRLKQLLENLFRNAVEHGETIDTVRVGPLDAGFYVEDDGAGIPPDERDRVFDSGFTTSPNGTGFGLAIVEEIAEAHGWGVDVTEGDDGGARFEITAAGSA